jgi:phage terminase large subunit-like protein
MKKEIKPEKFFKKSKKLPKIWHEEIQGFNPWENLNGKYYFDLRVAKAVCDFFPKYLTHSKGEFAGKPFELRPWQKKYIGHLFAWKRKEDDLRRFRTSLLFIPKKNGKTQIAAGLALILLSADNEPGSEVYCCASDVGQASILFNAGANMVDGSDELSEFIRILKGYKFMEVETTKSILKVLSSEASTKHGPNVHGLIIDELHTQKNTELIDTLTAGVVNRRQPLILYLTTADFAGPSPCNDEYDYACKVRDGLINDMEYFPVIYETKREDDWSKVQTWKKANPNYGITVKPSYFKSIVKKAKEKPSELNKFLRLHLNVQTETLTRWINMEKWDSSGHKLKPEQLKNQACFGGLDLSSSKDITAFILFFPEFKACIGSFWVPNGTADERIEYQLWANEGYVDITDGAVVDYSFIRKRINELSADYDIKDIGYDPWNSSQLAIQLADEDGLPMIEFRQGFKSMNEPSKELEKLVEKGELIHFNNPVLRWMCSNCAIKEDAAGNIKPIKPKKNSKMKIDGMVALVMAVGLSIARHEEEDENVYEKRGLVTL